MCILRHKEQSGQNIPSWSQNFTNYIFVSNFTDNYGSFPQIWDHIMKRVFPKLFCFVFTLSSKMSWNMCKSRQKFSYAKNWVAIGFPRQSMVFLTLLQHSITAWNWKTTFLEAGEHCEILLTLDRFNDWESGKEAIKDVNHAEPW